MSRFYYDLHLHSCLSPCGDGDMTPSSIAGMGKLNGLDIMALTDHNTLKNCPAFFKAAQHYGIIPIAGTELTTAEDIHAVCLFPRLETAMRFERELSAHRNKLKNRPEIFGEQLVTDENDVVTGSEDTLLSAATDIALDDALRFVRENGGICYPAHIDRDSNSVLAVLGAFPDYIGFTAAEYHDPDKVSPLKSSFAHLNSLHTIISSDAHYLWDISERGAFFELDCERERDAVTDRLFKLLSNAE